MDIWERVSWPRLCFTVFVVFLAAYLALSWDAGLARQAPLGLRDHVRIPTLKKIQRDYLVYLRVANETSYAKEQGMSYRAWRTYWHNRRKQEQEIRAASWEAAAPINNPKCKQAIKKLEKRKADRRKSNENLSKLFPGHELPAEGSLFGLWDPLADCKYKRQQIDWGDHIMIERKPTLGEHGAALTRTIGNHGTPFATALLLALAVAFTTVYFAPYVGSRFVRWLMPRPR